MLDLSTVTLCAIATRDHEAAAYAFRKSQDGVAYRNEVVFSDKPELFVGPNLAKVRIPPFAEYPDVCIWWVTRFADLVLPLIGTHCLQTNWDGFVLNPGAWREDFLQWDFIGSPMHGHTTGNNGFCLCSRRFYEAMKGLNVAPNAQSCFPSDQKVCIQYRAHMEAQGVRFAPVEVARQFARENDPPYGTESFGGHGKLFVANVVQQNRYILH